LSGSELLAGAQKSDTMCRDTRLCAGNNNGVIMRKKQCLIVVPCTVMFCAAAFAGALQAQQTSSSTPSTTTAVPTVQPPVGPTFDRRAYLERNVRAQEEILAAINSKLAGNIRDPAVLEMLQRARLVTLVNLNEAIRQLENYKVGK
jgi:hypothetical protein